MNRHFSHFSRKKLFLQRIRKHVYLLTIPTKEGSIIFTYNKTLHRFCKNTEITTTLQTYGHVLDELEQREPTHISELMSNIYR